MFITTSFELKNFTLIFVRYNQLTGSESRNQEQLIFGWDSESCIQSSDVVSSGRQLEYLLHTAKILK